MLTICYPYVSLEPIITKLSAQNWIDATAKKNQASDRDLLMSGLNSVPTEIMAELLCTDLKVKEFLNLKVGDIVPSETKISKPLNIYVNRSRKFLGRPGLKAKKKAFQILQDCSAED